MVLRQLPGHPEVHIAKWLSRRRATTTMVRMKPFWTIGRSTHDRLRCRPSAPLPGREADRVLREDVPRLEQECQQLEVVASAVNFGNKLIVDYLTIRELHEAATTF